MPCSSVSIVNFKHVIADWVWFASNIRKTTARPSTP